MVLAVTGAEALYADMGHFGRRPITRVWLILVFPACILSYMGQGALILGNPSTAIGNPFFLLVPSWGRVPLVFLAAAATVIASQAVITGAFSVAHQAVQLGYLPRLRIAHTSDETIGQIYVPWINWLLMVSVITLVVTFKSSAALAFAFGMAVTGTITITTLLFLYIVRHQWGKPLWLVVIGGGCLLTVDLLFLAANLTKIAHGAWLPLLIAIVDVHGAHDLAAGSRSSSRAQRERDEGSLRDFIDGLHASQPPVQRVPGTAVFLNRSKVTAPLAMRAQRGPPPRAPRARRHPLDRDDARARTCRRRAARRSTTSATPTTGSPTSARASATWTSPTCRRCCDSIEQADIECPLDVDEASRTSSPRSSCGAATRPGMSRWRKRLFLATSRITADAAEYFRLPRDRTVIMGSRIEVGVRDGELARARGRTRRPRRGSRRSSRRRRCGRARGRASPPQSSP